MTIPTQQYCVRVRFPVGDGGGELKDTTACVCTIVSHQKVGLFTTQTDRCTYRGEKYAAGAMCKSFTNIVHVEDDYQPTEKL